MYKLVELLDREGATQRAIEVVQAQLGHTSTATLHHQLADLLVRAGPGHEERAVEHYSRALALDPGNQAAIQGLQKMEAASDGMEATYDLSEMEEKYEVCHTLLYSKLFSMQYSPGWQRGPRVPRGGGAGGQRDRGRVVRRGHEPRGCHRELIVM